MTYVQIKRAVRRYHPEYHVQFRSDGQVWARPRRVGSSWGVLYTVPQLQRFVLLLRERA